MSQARSREQDQKQEQENHTLQLGLSAVVLIDPVHDDTAGPPVCEHAGGLNVVEHIIVIRPEA